MQTIMQDIRNQSYKQIYLLYGQEAYLRVQYKNKLKNALVPDGDTMNYSYYEGKDINIPELIDLAETMPFFADRRVIFLENTGMAKDGNEQFAEYVSSGIPESTVFVLTETAVDKRNKLFKAIAKAGACIEFTEQTEETLKKWILSKVKNEGKQITGNTLNHFLETVGTDMQYISTEMEKVFAYTYGRDTITDADIDAICSVRLVNKIFDMIGKIGLKQQKEVVRMYNELLELKESPFGILSLIQRQFNIMLQMADLMERGLPLPQIANKVGLSPYIAKKYLPQLQCFTKQEMVKVLDSCANVDYDIKRGNVRAEVGVELLVIECSM